jgi:hypothetical protein
MWCGFAALQGRIVKKLAFSCWRGAGFQKKAEIQSVFSNASQALKKCFVATGCRGQFGLEYALCRYLCNMSAFVADIHNPGDQPISNSSCNDSSIPHFFCF